MNCLSRLAQILARGAGCLLMAVPALPGALCAPAAQAPSRFGIDAPELARLGEHAVGVRTLRLVERDQPSVLEFDATRGEAPLRDRVLVVEVWYPAAAGTRGRPASYTGDIADEQNPKTFRFTVPGIAYRNAPPERQRWPLVVVSHGFSNAPAAMTWLTENLASKGYVVAAIGHADPSITQRANAAEPILRRALDIAFVSAELRRSLGEEGLVDPDRVALVGYSFGGYGVLTAGGARLDPKGPLALGVPGGLLLPFVEGGAREAEAHVPGVRAVVAIAPWGGGKIAAWSAQGLQALSAPVFMIGGTDDRTVGYRDGPRALFEGMVHADRYLLSFREAGHRIGLNPPPASTQDRLWRFDWFADPVWRAERVNAINAHFISAFLDRYVKDDASRQPYLDVAVSDINQGVWPGAGPSYYGAYSPGSGEVTLWKGFQDRHATGLELLHLAPAAP